jgi:hypothetical protein
MSDPDSPANRLRQRHPSTIVGWNGEPGHFPIGCGNGWIPILERCFDQWRMQDLAFVRRGIVAEMDLNPRTAFAALELGETKEPRPHRAGPDAFRMAQLTQSMIAAGKR